MSSTIGRKCEPRDREGRRADADGGSVSAEPTVDLASAGSGSGPRWGMQSEELNATLLAWPPGHEVPEHTNHEREVMLIVLEGSARVAVDGVEHQVAADQLLLIPRGCVRSIRAGPGAVRYLSIHLRRDPLMPAARRVQ
jgi:quercetin dioxygenase-like cupin family protein